MKCIKTLCYLIMLIYGTGLSAEVTVTVITKYIDITANNPKDFIEKLRIVKSPVIGDAFAWIHSDTLSELTYTTTAEGCSLNSLDSEIEFTITLPRWTNVEQRNEHQQKWWNRLNEFIIDHENAHKENVIDATKGLLQASQKIPPQPNCAEVKREYNRLKQLSLDQLRHQNHRLDFVDGGRIVVKDFLFLDSLPDVKPKPTEEPR